MSKTKAGTTDTRSNQAEQAMNARQGSGKHRGKAAGQEEPGQHTQGRHRRPPQEAEGS